MMAEEPCTAADLLASFTPRQTPHSPGYERRMAVDATTTLPNLKGEPPQCTQTMECESHSTSCHSMDSPLTDMSLLTPTSGYGAAMDCPDLEVEGLAVYDDEKMDLTTTPVRTLRPRPWLKRGRSELTNDIRGRQSAASSPSPIACKVMRMASQPEQQHQIDAASRSRLENFLLHHKALFLPLLPLQNHIRRIEQTRSPDAEDAQQISFKLLDSQPAGVQATLKEHQMTGLAFLIWLQKNGASGILADEMGLGKTLQTLSLFQYLEEEANFRGSNHKAHPHLVICPLSVIDSWVHEARKWTPGLKVLRFHGPPNQRAELKRVAVGLATHSEQQSAPASSKKRARSVSKLSTPLLQSDHYSLIVTSYEVFAAEKTWLKRAFHWNYVVLDEGHKIKNDATQVSLALQHIRAKHRLILTGTPLQNNLHEMWSLLHWLFPQTFTDSTSNFFRDAFNLNRGSVNTEALENTKRLLELICLRRLKDSPTVHLDLPPKHQVLLYAPLTAFQQSWYTRLLTNSSTDVLQAMNSDGKMPASYSGADDGQLDHEDRGEAIDAEQRPTAGAVLQHHAIDESNSPASKSLWQRLMNLIMQLRKVCTHPYLIVDAAPEPYVPGKHLILASGKFVMLQKLVEELVIKKRKKMLIFSGFVGTLDLIEDMLSLLGSHSSFKHTRFDGNTPRARRNLAIRLFNSSPGYMIMLISTRAGGLGINLTAATEVVFMDEDWNPQVTLQAEARAHRIGQTKPVTIYKLCTQGTVEEQMLSRIRKKLYLSAKVTGNMRNIHEDVGTSQAQVSIDEDLPQLDNSSLKALIRHGSRVLDHPSVDVDALLAWDLKTMVARCRETPLDSNTDASEGDHVNEEQWLSIMERVDCATFDGKKHKRQRAEHTDKVQEDLARADRRHGKHTTVMVDGFAVSKESMRCAEWEAVPTLAGKGTSLSDPPRKNKGPIKHQGHCHICHDQEDLLGCSLCPRSYHGTCLEQAVKVGPPVRGFTFICPQHRCYGCQKNTTDAGGMLYRCRWCPWAWCEDCLGSDERLTFVGDTLPEYESLGHYAHYNSFFICCSACAVGPQVDEHSAITSKAFMASNNHYDNAGMMV